MAVTMFIFTTYILEFNIFCGFGYSHIDGECYDNSDLEELQAFILVGGEDINISLDSNKNGVVDPLELGNQQWEAGKLIYWDCYDNWNYCGLSGEPNARVAALLELTISKIAKFVMILLVMILLIIIL